jgi:hypothetical protein
MARPRQPGRKVIRLSANIPEVIIHKWEELIKRENGYLPFNRSQRLELAILEHTRVMERRLNEPLSPTEVDMESSRHQSAEKPYNGSQKNEPPLS